MKKLIITLGIIICALASNAQWTVIKKFNKPLRFIESTQQGIVVATDSSYYIQQGIAFQNWVKYTLNDVILDMDSKGYYVFFASSKRIYEHGTAPKKIHDITSSNKFFESIDIYKGKKLVSLNGQQYGFKMFCSFSNDLGQFDTLDYSSTAGRYPSMTISSDDSLAFIGYSNYYGGLVFDMPTKKWKPLIPMESEVVYDSYLNNKIIMLRYKKAGTDFYISHDYGKTYTTQADVFPFNSNSGSVMEYYNGNAFIGFNNNLKGVFQSSNDGQSWTNILADSSITGMAVNGKDLFVTTNKGSLLKTTIGPIVTLIDKSDNTVEAKFYYSNKTIYNNSSDQVEYVIHDLSGKRILKGIIEPLNQVSPTLSEGIYIVEYLNNKITKREKITVW